MKKSIKNFVSVIFKIMIILVSSAAGLILIAICDDLGWIHTSVEDNHILAIIIWITAASIAFYFIFKLIICWIKYLFDLRRKAKAYDKALETAKYNYGHLHEVNPYSLIDTMFPELTDYNPNSDDLD